MATDPFSRLEGSVCEEIYRTLTNAWAVKGPCIPMAFDGTGAQKHLSFTTDALITEENKRSN
jgi:hypothetical protein